MQFDPTRKFSIVYGSDPSRPGAKFEQGPYIYNAHHQCINPDVDAPKVDPVAQATESMITELTEKLEIAAVDLKKAKENVAAFATTVNKSKFTKTNTKYEAIKSELHSLMA
jgi:hypothetical protein